MTKGHSSGKRFIDVNIGQESGNNRYDKNDWGVSHTPYGDIYHYDPNKFKPDVNKDIDVNSNIYIPELPPMHINHGFGAEDRVNLGELIVESDLLETKITEDGHDERNESEISINTAYAGVAVLAYPQSGTLKFTLDIRAISAAISPLKNFLSQALAESIPIAGRCLGVMGMLLMPRSIAEDLPNPNYYNIDFDTEDPYAVTTLPFNLVTSVKPDKIIGGNLVSAEVIVSVVVDEKENKNIVVITPVKNATIPVVKAYKTENPKIYTASIISGKPPVNIAVKNNVISNVENVNTAPMMTSYIPAKYGVESHHAIIDFSGEYDPIYISLSQLSEFSDDGFAEKTINLWNSTYPIESAEKILNISDVELRKSVFQLSDAANKFNKLRTINLGEEIINLSYYQRGFEQARNSHFSPGMELYGKYVGDIRNKIDYYFDVINKYRESKICVMNAEINKNKAERKLTMLTAQPDEVHAINIFDKKLYELLLDKNTFLIDGSNADKVQLSTKGSGIIEQKNNEGDVVNKFTFFSEKQILQSMFSEGNSYITSELLRVERLTGQVALTIPLNDIKMLNGYAENHFRGKWIQDKNSDKIKLIYDKKTQNLGKIEIVFATKERLTGLYKAVLPSSAGTILINPANPPVPQSFPRGIPIADLKLPVHTGTSIDILDIPDISGTPIPDDVKFNDFVLVFPDGSGLKPIYIMLSSPYGETNTKGKYSGRNFHTDRAGGPILELDWRTAVIDRNGVNKVKLHVYRFEESPENKVMIERLESILRREFPATDTDKRFYTHEIRELERYRNLGIKDGEVPENKAEVWNNTHAATLEDYKVNERIEPLYTPDAIDVSEQ